MANSLPLCNEILNVTKYMPYKSQAQRKYMHTHAKELLRQGVDLAEWDRATKGKKLPQHSKKKK